MTHTLVEAYLERQEPELLDHLAVRMTQDEFRMAWAVQWISDADGYLDAFPLENFATPGSPPWTDRLGERFLRAVRYLALSCGYEFHNLECTEAFSVKGRGKDPILANRAYLLPVVLGVAGFDRLLAVRTLLREAERHAFDAFPFDAVRAVASEMQEAAEHVAASATDPELRRRKQEERAAAYAQLHDAVGKMKGSLN